MNKEKLPVSNESPETIKMPAEIREEPSLPVNPADNSALIEQPVEPVKNPVLEKTVPPVGEKPPIFQKNPKKLITFDSHIVIFSIFLFINIVLLVLTAGTLPKYLKLKEDTRTEIAYAKEGITQDKLMKMNIINPGFPNEKRIIEMVSELNKVKEQFSAFAFNFATDEPKTGEQKYLPFTIKVTGSSDPIFSLVTTLTSAKEIMEITDFAMTEGKNHEKDAIIEVNMYISEGFNY